VRDFTAKKTASRATLALGTALKRAKPEVVLNSQGYVRDPSDNLLDGVRLEDIEADLRQGDGNELDTKFRAAHSSSALAVNNFAPFKRRPGELSLVGMNGLGRPCFEQKCPTGLAGKPPNLDLVAKGDSGVVGVESKCTEFLHEHIAKFRPAYAKGIRDDRQKSPWFAEMERLTSEPTSYVWLDAAQLIKHAFGLARTFQAPSTILLYLFWEPTNARDFSIFDEHRREISDLQVGSVVVAQSSERLAIATCGLIGREMHRGGSVHICGICAPATNWPSRANEAGSIVSWCAPRPLRAGRPRTLRGSQVQRRRPSTARPLAASRSSHGWKS
jgi:hypothetical protein